MRRGWLYKLGLFLAFAANPAPLLAQPELVQSAAPPEPPKLAPVAGSVQKSESPAKTETPPVKLEPGTALERARSLYEAGRFDRCRQAYAEVLPKGAPPPKGVDTETLEQSRLYYAACLLAIGERELAEAQVRAALSANPLMASPDPVVFPSQVRDLFFTVKSDFLEEIRVAQENKLRQAEAMTQARLARAKRERERVLLLEQLATQESLIHQNRRWIAAIPFGVGQFQNGDDGLGAFFLVSETLLLATTVTAVSLELKTHVDAGGSKGIVGAGVFDQASVNEALQSFHTLQIFSLAGFVLTTGIGVLEAQWNFKKEIPLGTRTRPLPEKARPRPESQSTSINPVIAPTNSGAIIGVSGQF